MNALISNFKELKTLLHQRKTITNIPNCLGQNPMLQRRLSLRNNEDLKSINVTMGKVKEITTGMSFPARSVVDGGIVLNFFSM